MNVSFSDLRTGIVTTPEQNKPKHKHKVTHAEILTSSYKKTLVTLKSKQTASNAKKSMTKSRHPPRTRVALSCMYRAMPKEPC